VSGFKQYVRPMDLHSKSPDCRGSGCEAVVPGAIYDALAARLAEAERLFRLTIHDQLHGLDDDEMSQYMAAIDRWLTGAPSSAKPADSPRPVLLDRSLRERAHELRREACSAWSDVVTPPHNGLSQAKCDYAAATEARLKAIIDELADGYVDRALGSAPVMQEFHNIDDVMRLKQAREYVQHTDKCNTVTQNESTPVEGGPLWECKCDCGLAEWLAGSAGGNDNGG